MQQLREWLEEDRIVESFEVTDKYKRLSKSEADKLWMKVLNTNDDMLPGLYDKKPQLKTYIVKNEYYYYRGKYAELYRSIRFFRTYVFHYRRPFIDIDLYIKKHKAR
jgi:hypothetical protein